LLAGNDLEAIWDDQAKASDGSNIASYGARRRKSDDSLHPGGKIGINGANEPEPTRS
jgi:hypothetical protein